MSEIIKDPSHHLGSTIVDMAANFRAECLSNGIKYKKEEFLIGILMGMKVFVAIEYREGQELKVLSTTET